MHCRLTRCCRTQKKKQIYDQYGEEGLQAQAQGGGGPGFQYRRAEDLFAEVTPCSCPHARVAQTQPFLAAKRAAPAGPVCPYTCDVAE